MTLFIITGAIAALLLGGLAWFNFSFKPNMIKTIMSSQVPPPATVTSEAARTEQRSEERRVGKEWRLREEEAKIDNIRRQLRGHGLAGRYCLLYQKHANAIH